MEENKKPIGFFDSGVGGISVLKQTLKLLPKEHYIYLGDNANVPYGNKSEEQIKEISLKCGDFLYEKGVKAIVVACNTATSIAVQTMREKLRIPVISIEPAVKPAADCGKEGKFIVLATPATIMQKRYNALLDRVGCREKVINVPCENLAAMIEKEQLDGDMIKNYIREKFMAYKDEDVFGVVLGCTHYSFIESTVKEVFKDVFSKECDIFDGKYGVAMQVKRVLESNGLVNDSDHLKIDFYATGDKSEIDNFKKFLII